MDGRKSGPRLDRRLMRGSIVVLAAGIGASRAHASCVAVTAAYTNSANVSCLTITNTSFSGDVENSGTISPGGISLSNGTITGRITDYGTVAATGGRAGISVDNSSVISSTSVAILLSGSTFTGGVSNVGTIFGGVSGIDVYGVDTFTGGIVNSSGGTIEVGASGSGAGIKIGTGTLSSVSRPVTSFSGGITNAGTISSGYTGIAVLAASSFAGGIVNSNGGTIVAGTSGSGAGIRVGAISTCGCYAVSQFSGGVANSGTISSGYSGIAVEGVTIFSGGVTNAGTITGGTGSTVAGIKIGVVTTSGSYSVSKFSGGVTNSGTISANAGISVAGVIDFSDGVTNSGTISAGEGIGVANVSTFTGGLTNSGIVSVGQTGLFVSAVPSFSGNISNSGTVSAGTNAGIYVKNITSFAGSIVNSGGITGHTGIVVKSGVAFSSGNGITNSGTISGTGGLALDLSDASAAVLLDEQGGTIAGGINFSRHGDTVTGYGTLGSNLTTSNATIWPTLAGTGLLHIAGNYTQSSTGTLVVEVNPTSASKLTVSGTAHLGGTLKIVYDPGTYHAKTYTLVSASSVSGKFSKVSGTAPSGIVSQTVTYDPNAVDLSLSDSASLTTNPGILEISPNVVAVTSNGFSGTVFSHLNNLRADEETETVKTALSARQPLQLAFNSGDLSQLGALAQHLPAIAKRYGAWVRGIGSFFSARSQGTDPGYSADSGGTLLGIDRKLSTNVVAGVAIGYSRTWLSQDDGSKGIIDTPRAMLYGSYRPTTHVMIDGVVGFAYDRIHTSRPVPALGTTAEESHNGYEENLALQAGYAIPWRNYLFVPRFGFRYLHLAQTSYDETGASGFDLSSQPTYTDSFEPLVSVTALTRWTTASGLALTPEFKLQYSRELLSTSQTLTLTTPAGSLVPAALAAPARNVVTFGPTLTAHLSRSLDLYADYKVAFGIGKSVDHTVFGGMRWKF